MHYQISRPQTARVKGSAFSRFFLQALWHDVQAVCGLERAIANQGMAVWLYSSAVLDYDLYFKISFIFVSFEPLMSCNLA